MVMPNSPETGACPMLNVQGQMVKFQGFSPWPWTLDLGDATLDHPMILRIGEKYPTKDRKKCGKILTANRQQSAVAVTSPKRKF
jgi:hypothetical protein